MRPQTHGHDSVKSEPHLQSFFTTRFLGKFAVKGFAYVATLPCETLLSENK